MNENKNDRFEEELDQMVVFRVWCWAFGNIAYAHGEMGDSIVIAGVNHPNE